MTRMGREFSLVLLGSGILTAGYFLAPSPEDELENKAEEQAAARVHGEEGENRTHHRRMGHGLPLILFVHSRGYAGGNMTRSPASPTVSRSGFGGMGRSMGASGS